jgi:hypothetical protein
MNEPGRRPGGLTALAVLNFVFGGLGAIGLLILVAALGVMEKGMESVPELRDAPKSWIWISLALGAVGVFLLIASGVSYLKLKKSGRTLGTAYGLFALAGTVVNLTVLKMPMNIGTFIGLIYPVLTLILVNTTFKEDLVN